MKDSIHKISAALNLNGEQFDIFMKYKIKELLDEEQDEARFEYTGMACKLKKTGPLAFALDIVVLTTGQGGTFDIDVDPADLPADPGD